MAKTYFQTSLPRPGIPTFIKDILATHSLTSLRGQSVRVVGRVFTFDPMTSSAVVVEPQRFNAREESEQPGLTVDLSLVSGEDFGVGSLVMMIGELEEREEEGGGKNQEDWRKAERVRKREENRSQEHKGQNKIQEVACGYVDATSCESEISCGQQQQHQTQLQKSQKNLPPQQQNQFTENFSPNETRNNSDSVQNLNDSTASLFDSSSKENSFVCDNENVQIENQDQPGNEPKKKKQRLTLSDCSRLNESDIFLLDAMDADSCETGNKYSRNFCETDTTQRNQVGDLSFDMQNDEVESMADVILLKARVATCVDRLDYELYKQSIEVMRKLSLQ